MTNELLALGLQFVIEAFVISSFSLVGAGRGIQALVSDHQTRHWFSAQRIQDFIDIRWRDVAVPDRLGIDHNVRPVLALIEASGLIRANFSLQSSNRYALFE